MPTFVVKYLREHLAAQAERRLASVAWADGDYVFDRGGGMPMSVESVSRRFGQLVETVGLGSVRAHDMRHSYATRLLEAGVHPKRSTPSSKKEAEAICRQCRSDKGLSRNEPETVPPILTSVFVS